MRLSHLGIFARVDLRSRFPVRYRSLSHHEGPRVRTADSSADSLTAIAVNQHLEEEGVPLQVFSSTSKGSVSARESVVYEAQIRSA